MNNPFTLTRHFGTDGIRGRVGAANMEPIFLTRLGYAFGSLILGNTKNLKQARPRVVIGRDTRASGDCLSAALTAGLMLAGVDVHEAGILPTPAISHLVVALSFDAGIVVSASHNPYHDNGVKFFNACGEKLSDREEASIEAHLDANLVPADMLGHREILGDAEARYVDYCTNTFPKTLNLQGLRVVFDGAHGAGYRVGPKILSHLGAEVIAIGCQPNGVNINANCGSTHTADLQAAVLAEKSDLGIAVDGDGDRLLLVDHNGVLVDGDEIVCLLAVAAKRAGECSGVVGTLMSNLGLEQALKSQDIPFERAAVGDRYVLAHLRKNGWHLGGENSGHILNLQQAPSGDAMLSALAVLKILRETEHSLAEAKQVMQRRPQVLLNVPMPRQLPFLENERIRAGIKHLENSLGESGRVLLRPSGTQPCVRVMVEANEAATARAGAESLAMLVKSALDDEAVR